MASEAFADELRAAVAGDKFTLYTELMLQAAELLDHKDEQINTRPAPVDVNLCNTTPVVCRETLSATDKTAATDTGLVTVCQKDYDFYEDGELVTRESAEAILAAEIRRERDLAAKQLSEVVDRMSDDYLALKADNSKLREAGSAVIASWDERGPVREQLKSDGERKWWSPASSMVSSEAIANLRAVLGGGKP